MNREVWKALKFFDHYNNPEKIGKNKKTQDIASTPPIDAWNKLIEENKLRFPEMYCPKCGGHALNHQFVDFTKDPPFFLGCSD